MIATLVRYSVVPNGTTNRFLRYPALEALGYNTSPLRGCSPFRALMCLSKSSVQINYETALNVFPSCEQSVKLSAVHLCIELKVVIGNHQLG